MPTKRISTDGTGQANDNQYKPPKSKPKPYMEADWIKELRLKRDRVIWTFCDEETKMALREKYGIKEI